MSLASNTTYITRMTQRLFVNHRIFQAILHFHIPFTVAIAIAIFSLRLCQDIRHAPPLEIRVGVNISVHVHVHVLFTRTFALSRCACWWGLDRRCRWGRWRGWRVDFKIGLRRRRLHGLGIVLVAYYRKSLVLDTLALQRAVGGSLGQ